ncbi:MAG TPA: TRAP transporter substrate-binding protein [Stellaceae bacterium]|nr:TRAP transporter substrate-binding protein [Stellaceae bacterium]
MAGAIVAVLSAMGANFAVRAETPAERASRGPLLLMTSGGVGTAVEMAQDLAGVLDETAGRGLIPLLGTGGVQNVIDLRDMRTLDFAIVQADVLDFVKRQNLVPGIETSATYAAKLYGQELHLLARADIAAVEQLAGKKVVFCGGATVTGPSMLSLLRITVDPLVDNEMSALRRLAAGEVAAVAYTAAKPSSFFQALEGGTLHFLSIPLTPDIALAYVPAQLTAEDYPRLVPADKPVDTIATTMVLLAASMPPGSERYQNAGRFIEAFLSKLPELRRAPHHPKWAEVNPAAELPGWKRFPPAEAWLKRNAVAGATSLDAKDMRNLFAKFLEERGKHAEGYAAQDNEPPAIGPGRSSVTAPADNPPRR